MGPIHVSMDDVLMAGNHKMHHSARLALTRAEVIVIILLLGVLMAMLVPGVVKVREASRFTECGSRLRSIAIAAHNYHSDYSRLPSGYYSAVKENGNNTRYAVERGPHVGVLVMLLPYMESGSPFSKLRVPSPTWSMMPSELQLRSFGQIDLKTEYAPYWTAPENLLPLAGQERLNYFECPSDNLHDDTATIGIVSLQISSDTFAYVTVPGAEKLGRTNYVGVAGMVGPTDDFEMSTPLKPKGGRFPGAESWGRSDPNPKRHESDRFVGCLYNRSMLTLGQITVQDGTSNTLFFGEALGGLGQGPRKTVFTWFGAGSLGTAFGLGDDRVGGFDSVTPPPLGSQPQPGTHGASWFRFSSRHPNRVNFASVDASVRGIRVNDTATPGAIINEHKPSDWLYLQQLAGRRDGINVDAVWIPD